MADVTLRTARSIDVAPCLELLNDPETARWATYPAPASIGDARALLESRDSVHTFVIDVGEFAGMARLRVNGSAAAALELAIHPSHRGRGIARRALGAAADWTFTNTEIPAIDWRCLIGDDRSWRVAWHNGFRFAATLPSAIDQRGEAHDAWAATLRRDDSREPKTTWLTPVCIEVDDLLLRPLDDSDETRYLEAMNNPEATKWLGAIVGMPRTTDEFRSSMRERSLFSSLGEGVSWVVADRATDAYLASISVFGFSSLDYKSAEVGYRTHPDARGRGVMTRSLRAVFTHAFAPEDDGGLGLERISLGAGDGNLASQGVARSCGFTETGRDRQCYDLADGTVVDLIRFDLLHTEFQA